MFLLVTCQKCKEYERTVRMEEADGAKLVQSISEKMAEMFRSKAQAARVGMAAESSLRLSLTSRFRSESELFKNQPSVHRLGLGV